MAAGSRGGGNMSLLRRRALLGLETPLGLEGEWLFSGNTDDTSGKGNNGINFGASLTNNRHAVANSAYHFDNAQNDYISVDGVAQTPIITIAVWVKWTAANNVGIMSRASWVGGTQGDYNLALFNNEVYFRINNLAFTLVSTTGNMQNNTWRFVVASFDGAQMKLTIDDSNINTLSAPVSLDSFWTEIHFGQYFHEASNFSLTGDLDDIRIYNRLLTPAEITALFNE